MESEFAVGKQLLMKVLVADPISESGLKYLESEPNIEVLNATSVQKSELLKLAIDVDAIIVRSETVVSADLLEVASELKVVGRAGVGLDNIDLEEATQRGVVVMNTPEGNTVATAELTMTHLLCSARPITQAYMKLNAGEWERKNFSGSELRGKTLGIIGMGRIGGEVAKRAKGFDMRIIGYDPHVTEDRINSLEVDRVELKELFRRADFVTVHIPLTDSSRHLIDARALDQMKEGVRIINCARGGIVKEADLVKALRSGKVAAAGMDVFEKEPLPKDSELRNCPNLVISPHLGASTEEAQESVGLEISKAVTEMLNGGIIRNAVNMPVMDRRTFMIIKPYLDLGSRLGTVLQQIVPERIERLKIVYSGRLNDLNLVPLTRSIQCGFLRRISGRKINEVNAPTYMRRLGITVDFVVSSSGTDYTELVRLEAHDVLQNLHSVEGTLMGTNQNPRIVGVNGRAIEVPLEGNLLFLENKDRPGMIGYIGTLLGESWINIGDMSLSRNSIGGLALTTLVLDSVPPGEVLGVIEGHDAIRKLNFVEVD